MSTGALRRRIVTLASAAALCVAVPGAALAGEGGDPNDGNGHSKACEKIGKRNGGPKANDQQRKAKMGRGHKCGLRGGPHPNGS
jgi:hypothetical protein